MNKKNNYKVIVNYADDTNRILFISSDTPIKYSSFRLSDYLSGPSTDGVVALGIFESN